MRFSRFKWLKRLLKPEKALRERSPVEAASVMEAPAARRPTTAVA